MALVDGAGPAGLTGREVVIIGLLAAGRTTLEIGSLLDLRPHVVENHKRHIYSKLDVDTQHGAVAQAIALGVLAGPRRVAHAGRSMVVLVRGPAGGCRDAVMAALVADGTPFVTAWQPETLACDHWARWHRGPVVGVLVDPSSADWDWSASWGVPVLVVRGERGAVADVVARRAGGLLLSSDVPGGLAAALRAVAAGLFVVGASGAAALSGRRPAAVPELTPRERDILDSIALGHTIRQTARALGIATKTVENTQARLFRKLGARNRSETLAVAWEVGLLGDR